MDNSRLHALGCHTIDRLEEGLARAYADLLAG
jgi:hypothetical protein